MRTSKKVVVDSRPVWERWDDMEVELDLMEARERESNKWNNGHIYKLSSNVFYQKVEETWLIS